MSTSSSSLSSTTRETAYPSETIHHHECIELLMPEHIRNNIVMSTVLEEMPPQAQTMHRPVVLTHASDSSTSQHDKTETSGKT